MEQPISSRARVAIAGGGVAALEAALALRALAGDRVRLTLISPNATFFYRPAATVETVRGGPAHAYDLRAIAADLGAAYHQAGLEAVAPQQHWVRLANGARLAYDALILALGARARAGVPGALTFRDQRDVPQYRRVLSDVLTGRIGRLVLAVPSRDSWPLPAYELALLTAARAAQEEVGVEIALVTPEPAPLGVFGSKASRVVGDLLAERRVRFVGASIPHSVRRDGSLNIQFDGAIEADRVVAVPELRGQRITGVPANWSGFVPTDAVGRVTDVTDVYAAGDMTTFPVRQGGIAAQQADRIAHTIAAGLGAPVKELREARVLLARLLDGDSGLVLRTELDEFGQPTKATIEHYEPRRDAAPKVFARYLTPYLSGHGASSKVAAA